MKVCLMKVFGKHCYDCGIEPAYYVTDWTEVTEVEYRALQKYVLRKINEDNEVVLILQEPYDKHEFQSTVKEALEYQARMERKDHLAKVEMEKKKRERQATKDARNKVTRKKQYEELKKEFESKP